jgi:hypothetical protein
MFSWPYLSCVDRVVQRMAAAGVVVPIFRKRERERERERER